MISRNKTRLIETAGLFAILSGEIILAYYNCMLEFDLDHGSVIADGGYRLFLGQVPYRDFFMPIGPVVFWIQSVFFSLSGGFFWKSIALHTAVMGAVATLFIFLIIRLHTGSIPSLVFTFFAAVTFYMPKAYPWYDQTAFIFYLMALFFFTLAHTDVYKINKTMMSVLAALSGLAITASIFSKHNIGSAALGLTVPLWLLARPHIRDTCTDRIKRCFICLSFSLLPTIFLIVYVNSQVDFIENIFVGTGQMQRLLKLLPHEALKEWLSFDYGKIVFLIYFSLAALPMGMSYLFSIDLKKLFSDRVLLGSIISLTGVNYTAQLTSVSGAFTAFSLISLLVGLFYVMISGIEYVDKKIKSKRFSNFCFVITGVALCIISLWGATDEKIPFSISRLVHLDIFFITIMMIIAVFFLACGLLKCKSKEGSTVSSRSVIIGSKAWLLLLLVSVVVYYGYFHNLHFKAILQQVLVGAESKTLVQFKDVPALEGVYADSRTVKSIEDLYVWLHTELEEDPSLKNDKEIYIFPQGQSLYGIMGLESFKDVYLWLHYKLTYSTPDPDTEVILKKSPSLIIKYSANKRFNAEMQEYMPGLQKILSDNYMLAGQFDKISIFRRINN